MLVFANVSYETLILEDFLDAFKGGGPLVGQNMIKMKLSSKELYKELSKLTCSTCSTWNTCSTCSTGRYVLSMFWLEFAIELFEELHCL